MKKIITSALFVFSVITGFAQIPPHRTCGTMDYHNYLMQTRPNYATDYTQYNQMINQYIQNNQGALNTAAKTANITIPVVIHVLYNTAAQNISDAQAISQFAVLNNDFQRLNADKVNTPSTFTAVAGGVGITFCLAQRTPSGTATTGVIHKSTSLTSFTTDNKIKFSAQGGDDAWDVTKYINIWIGNISGGILGYGEFPTTSLSNTYGLVLNYTATGTSGTAAAPYNLGRTGTHEFGHCFNLNHIWGDNGQCGNTDNCYDTPPQKGGTNSPAGCNYGTPTYPWQPNTCTRPDGIGGASMTNVNGDMFMNYMDYTDDAVMNMFTQQQCVRMLAVVSNPPWNVLASSNGCTPISTSGAPVASFSVSVSKCVGSPITFTDLSTNTPTNWSWSFPGGTPSTSTSQNPSVTYSVAGTYTATLLSANSSGTSAAVSQTIAVIAKPTVAVTSATTCAGSTKTLTASGASTYSWNTGVTTSTMSATPTTNTSYTVTGTATTGCTNTAVGTISVTSLPTVVATSTAVCVGSSAVLTASGASTYSWSTGATTPTMLAAPATNTSYTVTGTATTGCKNMAVGTITVNVLPTVVATNTSVCTGNSAVLTASGASTYSWSTGAGTTTISVTPTTNTSYTVIGTSTAGCTNTAVGSVTVNVLPTVAATSATTCAGNSKTLTASGASTYSWSTGAITSTMSATPTTNTSYTVTGTAITGCKNTAFGTISLTALPTVVVTSTAVCFGSSAVLTASGASTYSWSTGASTSTISATPTTNTSYTVIGTATTGCTNTAVGSIAVNALPTVSASSTTICAGSTGTLTASGASTYTWSSGTNGVNLVASPTSNTTYTVVGSSIAGCNNSATGSIFVGSAPVITVNSSTICAGSTATLSASGVNSYTWNTGANTSTLIVNPSSTTIYSVSGNLTGCSTAASQTATVTVTSLPIIAATSATTCIGNSAVLTASGASTYSWSTGVTTSTMSATPTTNTSYTVTGTATTGCKNISVGIITVNALPTVVATSTSICVGNSAVLTASGASTYSWSSGATTPTISAAPTTNTSYTVTGTAITGCKNTSVGTITVNALPTIVATSTTVCAGSSGVLTASGASNYSWSIGATTSTMSATPTTNTSYTVTGTATTGCKNTAVGTISVTSLPNVVATSTAVCAGSVAIISASGASTYSWSTGASTSMISATPTINTSYTVTGTATTGCKSIAVGSVTVNALPTIVATSTAICIGSSATLTGSGASTYSWSSGATTSTISIIPTTNTSYTVTGTSIIGCKNTAIGTVTVNALPNVTVTSSTICSGSTGTLTASGASTYAWNTGATGSNLTASPTSNTNYTVTGTSVAGCTKSATATIVVGSAPVITVNSSTICSGSTATLSASGVNSYTWNTSANTPAIIVNPSSTTVYTVSGNLTGCSTGASKTVTVTVNALPVVSLAPISQLCVNSSAVMLMGSPSNGTYTGSGVSGSMFNPSISGAGTFTVIYYYTDANNCSNSASQPASVSLCTGIAEVFNASAIAIYPNPAKDVVYVNINSSAIDNTTIELYDAIGKLIVSQKVVDTISTLSLSDLSKGIYSIRITTDSHQVVKRIVKE